MIGLRVRARISRQIAHLAASATSGRRGVVVCLPIWRQIAHLAASAMSGRRGVVACLPIWRQIAQAVPRS
jgi:hypothetical protein